MSTISTPRQRELLNELKLLIAHRRERERSIEAAFAEGLEQEQQRYRAQRSEVQDRYQLLLDTLQGEYLFQMEDARESFEARRQELQAEYDAVVAQAEESHRRAIHEGDSTWTQTRALTLQNFEADLKHSEETAQNATAAVQAQRQQFEWIERQTRQLLRRRGRSLPLAEIPPTDPEISSSRLLQTYADSARRLHEELRAVSQRPSVRFVDEGWPVLLAFALMVLIGIPVGRWFGWTGWQWPTVTVVLASLTAVVVRQVVETWSRRQLTGSLQAICDHFSRARQALSHAEEMVPVECRRRNRDLEKRKNRQLRQADETWQIICQDLQEEKSATIAQAAEKKHQELSLAERSWNARAAECREHYLPRIEETQNTCQQLLAEMDRQHAEVTRELERRRDQEWQELIDSWQSHSERIRAELCAMHEECQRLFPALDSIDWEQWQPPVDAIQLPAIRLGEYVLDLERIEGGIPDDPRLRLAWTQVPVPAVLALPQAPSLVIETELDGRRMAVELLQQAMLRLLTALPPGKVRFTIFDPTALGENFSAFMHLSDFDERLVTNRIWTEATHIQQRLTDLTEHMENVIQKYLRNEFASIQEYNSRAGEIAEPFQVLVVANFPVNFSEESARRLVSIASSGARCGVYFLISVDSRQQLPNRFELADLEAAANVLLCRDGRFLWKYEDLQGFPSCWESPPPAEVIGQIVRTVGRLAKDANRVEVPFESVIPSADQWWTQDSRHQLQVPLGRAGATKLQYLTLGQGTSQHVLIAGKTGSGKSTLLNAIITNLALYYSPDELQFDLVDFKKGVEFRAYAVHRLPHARVIAIESEREFGLSVLERLDHELQIRGEKFRACGAQNLAAFREAEPQTPMPRILLMVDEFQEFFVKDDKISQEAALLLDRLVRQGRAFGIHVLLGSQTLAGAYTLARSTLGQMAVRIALQCSESDAHLILSEENTAARLLNRPGEAIYNNANGLFEGNHPFQVVWLSDAQREVYLRQLTSHANGRAGRYPAPIIFEGNVPADPSDNRALLDAWTADSRVDQSRLPTAWLGAAISIKPPTQVIFRPQTGANLLIVGQQDELALGLLATGLLGLGAATRRSVRNSCYASPSSIQSPIILLDGGGFDANATRLRAVLQRWKLLQVEIAGPGETEHLLQTLAQELEHRLASPVPQAGWSPLFLAIYNLARFRELRRSEDDFGLGSFASESTTSPAQHLARLLREGPTVGIHSLIWCDTYNNLSRWFDRGTLRDLSHRVLFQMSATDSSNLMDASSASQLGNYRAVLHDEERGESERFRPYRLPDEGLIQRLRGDV